MQQNDYLIQEVEALLDAGRYVPRSLIRMLADQLRACEAEIKRLALIILRSNSHGDPGDGGPS